MWPPCDQSLCVFVAPAIHSKYSRSRVQNCSQALDADRVVRRVVCEQAIVFT